jgi:hypothetical protein
MLRSDVVEVLVLTDADQVDLTCTMVGTTRTGYCLFEADAELVERFGTEFALNELEPGASLLFEAQVGCLTPEALGDVGRLRAQGVSGRPESLVLSDGQQFEYLLLLYDPVTDQVCVQVSYTYG